jgi:hypothetical protein
LSPRSWIFVVIGAWLLCAGCSTSQPLPLEASNILQRHATGAEILSEREAYRLVPSGEVWLFDQVVSDSANGVSPKLSWSSRLGRYQMVIRAESENHSKLTPVETQSLWLAYNSRTERPAVVTGQIIVKLVAGVSADDIASDFDLILVRDFGHIQSAVFRVKLFSRLNASIKTLKSDARIAVAYAEIIENIPTHRE